MKEFFTATFTKLFSLAGGGGSSFHSGFSGGTGGSHSEGSTLHGNNPFIVLAIVIVIFVIVSAIALYSGRKVRQQRAKLQKQLISSQNSDPAWNQAALIEHAKKTFIKYQNDWSNFDGSSMKTYMTKQYYAHAEMMMAALKTMHRQNVVDSVRIADAVFQSIEDNDENNKDKCTIRLTFSALDTINDSAENKQLYSQKIVTAEDYTFTRRGESWLLSGIRPSSANDEAARDDIIDFAKKNDYFYSLDWGWLLLPRRGQLFSDGAFGTSDINNHVIGVYADMIIQLYTYNENPGQNGRKPYVIAQSSLPRSYGDIVVRRKGGLLQHDISGLTKLKTESGDFNKKYEVFTSDEEKAASFELLHPAFIEKLTALPFEVNIEVVDNVVYLYTGELGADYAVMLDCLKHAFKEMKM